MHFAIDESRQEKAFPFSASWSLPWECLYSLTLAQRGQSAAAGELHFPRPPSVRWAGSMSPAISWRRAVRHRVLNVGRKGYRAHGAGRLTRAEAQCCSIGERVGHSQPVRLTIAIITRDAAGAATLEHDPVGWILTQLDGR